MSRRNGNARERTIPHSAGGELFIKGDKLANRAYRPESVKNDYAVTMQVTEGLGDVRAELAILGETKGIKSRMLPGRLVVADTAEILPLITRESRRLYYDAFGEGPGRYVGERHAAMDVQSSLSANWGWVTRGPNAREYERQGIPLDVADFALRTVSVGRDTRGTRLSAVIRDEKGARNDGVLASTRAIALGIDRNDRLDTPSVDWVVPIADLFIPYTGAKDLMGSFDEGLLGAWPESIRLAGPKLVQEHIE